MCYDGAAINYPLENPYSAATRREKRALNSRLRIVLMPVLLPAGSLPYTPLLAKLDRDHNKNNAN